MKIYRHPSSFSISYFIITEHFYIIVRRYRDNKKVEYDYGFDKKFSSEKILIENGYQILLEKELKLKHFFIKAPFEA